VEQQTSTPGTAHSARTAVVGGAIGMYAFFDSLLAGVPLVLLAALLNPLIVFCAAAVGLTVLNIGAATGSSATGPAGSPVPASDLRRGWRSGAGESS
jgi:hypothetical protein